ncbi:MAG: tRNA (adenosine(37)-N6)-dimethylallyltransferase MiaA [Patescibacteria group bacterium]|nr:tRNA (adenosine(37)-N6)-dimethylallyltransferase MiaA [Patescibacteria group bacterium]
MLKKPKLVVILGPTASGKTTLALKLAKRFQGEIISADSRQVYKSLNIGTSKPTEKERQAIPHHLIDIIYPNQDFNVAIYKKLAIKIIKDIQKRGKLPFLVGGTGLYIQAVVDNIEFPKVPPQTKLRKELEKKSVKELFKIYQKLDQKGGEIIEKENKRRLIRAIEVSQITKRPFFEQRKKGIPLFDVLQIGLKINKKKLKQKISKRVEKMFRQGLEKEVKNLAKIYGFEIPQMQTIGYQEWSSFVSTFAKATEDKKTSEDKKRIFFTLTKQEKEKVKELIIQHTWQFARRQLTWFKKHSAPEPSARCGAGKRINWIKKYQEVEKLVKNFLK